MQWKELDSNLLLHAEYPARYLSYITRVKCIVSSNYCVLKIIFSPGKRNEILERILKIMTAPFKSGQKLTQYFS